MTLDEWQRKESLVAWASKLFKDKRFRLLSEMLDTMHPKHFPKPDGMSADRELGRIYGYDIYKSNMEAAAFLRNDQELPEATFEPIEKED